MRIKRSANNNQGEFIKNRPARRKANVTHRIYIANEVVIASNSIFYLRIKDSKV